LFDQGLSKLAHNRGDSFGQLFDFWSTFLPKMNTKVVQFGSNSITWSDFRQFFLPKNNRGDGQNLVNFGQFF
jgi:hypothetical protein